MDKVKTDLVLTDKSIKWGDVTVLNQDGSVNRQFRISAAEEDRVRNSSKGFPNGVTEEEWKTGRVTISGRSLEYKQAFLMKDGNLACNYNLGADSVGKYMDIGVRIIPAASFEIIDGEVYLDQDVLDGLPNVTRK